VSADTDSSLDFYERSGGTTTLVTTGPAGGNGPFDALSMLLFANGERIIFITAESLVSGDTDSSLDVYERFAGTTSLVSIGPSGGNGPFDSMPAAGWDPHSAGTHIYFTTEESLVSQDTDAFNDVYERSGGVTRLVSIGPIGGNGDFHMDGMASASEDGSHVFLMTAERLVRRDTDDSLDVYKRSGDSMTLISAGPVGGNGPFDAEAKSDSSPDGMRILFATAEQLVKADTDNSLDIYAHVAGRTKLVTIGRTGGNGAFDVFGAGAARDITTLAFATSESLVRKDTDASLDVYTARVDP
jgi:hypothetical protein